MPSGRAQTRANHWLAARRFHFLVGRPLHAGQSKVRQSLPKHALSRPASGEHLLLSLLLSLLLLLLLLVLLLLLLLAALGGVSLFFASLSLGAMASLWPVSVAKIKLNSGHFSPINHRSSIMNGRQAARGLQGSARLVGRPFAHRALPHARRARRRCPIASLLLVARGASLGPGVVARVEVAILPGHWLAQISHQVSGGAPLPGCVWARVERRPQTSTGDHWRCLDGPVHSARLLVASRLPLVLDEQRDQKPENNGRKQWPIARGFGQAKPPAKPKRRISRLDAAISVPPSLCVSRARLSLNLALLLLHSGRSLAALPACSTLWQISSDLPPRLSVCLLNFQLAHETQSDTLDCRSSACPMHWRDKTKINPQTKMLTSAHCPKLSSLFLPLTDCLAGVLLFLTSGGDASLLPARPHKQLFFGKKANTLETLPFTGSNDVWREREAQSRAERPFCVT